MLRWTVRRRRWPPNYGVEYLRYILCFYALSLTRSTLAQRSNALDTPELVDGARLRAASENAAEPIDGFATGKLNQFKGFYTPRPPPQNVQFTYSSVWASWSAWSFCTNHEKIRVRACNTVRGFSCLGPNRETSSCGLEGDVPLTASTPTEERSRPAFGGRDYDAVDPWAEDRREALRQLYDSGDLPPLVELAHKHNGAEFSRTRSAGPTFSGAAIAAPPQHRRNNYGGGVGPQAPPVRPSASVDSGPPKAPSMTPELLFGSKLEIPDQHINSTQAADSLSSKDKLNAFQSSLIAMNASSSSTTDDRSIMSSGAFSSPLLSSNPEATTTSLARNTMGNADTTIRNNDNTARSLNLLVDAPDDEPTATVAKPLLPADLVLTDDVASSQLIAGASDLSLSSPAGEMNQLDLLNSNVEPMHNKIMLQNAGATRSSAEAGKRTTMAEMPMPEESVSNLGRSNNFQKNFLHSGEVIFPKEERISLETARAFEWMLANMSRAAEAELLLKNNASRRRAALHSGEAILPRAALLTSDEIDPVHHQKGVPPRPHFFPKSERTLRRKEAAKAYGARQWTPVSKAKQTEDTENKAQIKNELFSKNGDLSIRPSESIGDALSNASAEKLERDLLKIQSVMRQIEGELEALKLAESTLGGAQAFTKQPNLPEQQQQLQQKHQQLHQQLKQEKQQQSLRGRQSGSVRIRSNVRNNENREAVEKPIGIDLVPTIEPLHGTTTTATVTLRATESQILLVQSIGGAKEAEWSDWRPWAECFCGRQVRTRVCKYDDAFSSTGCSGRSYESRHCTSRTDNCPAHRTSTAEAITVEAITPEFYTLAPPRAGKRHDGAAFRSRPLAIASLSTSERQQ